MPLNKRFIGITPQGIYRGLTLTSDPLVGDRTIIISQDADNEDHVAVFQNENEFQVGYRDSTSGDITLTLTAYSSVDVLITLFIDYQIGLTTSGTYRVYTQAEFDGLAVPLRDSLIVMGTVTIPASGAIGASAISLNSRTLASANIQPGTIPSTLIARNSNFESGEVGQSYELSSQFWEKTSSAGVGAWKTSSDRADSGVKSIELTVSTAPFTGMIRQQAGIEVTAGQLITATVSVWQDKAVSSGTFVYFTEFSDSTDTLLSTSSQTLDAGIDAGWREVISVINVPVGAATIRSFGVQCIALDPDSVGVFAYIDSLRVLVEPRAADEAHVFDQRFRQRDNITGLRIADPSGNFADPSADISFDKDTPSGEGKVSLLPANPTDEPPAFELAGRMIELGSQLLATGVNALKARVSAEPALSGVSTYTLMWESQSSGVQGSRRYVKWDGTLVSTGNARWDGANWNKDVPAVEASRVDFGATDGSSRILAQGTGVDVWGDGAWTATNLAIASDGSITALTSITAADLEATSNIDTDTLTSTGLITAASLTSTGLLTASAALTAGGLITANAGLTAGANQHVTLSGGGRVKHGTYQLTLAGFHMISGFDPLGSNEPGMYYVPNRGAIGNTAAGFGTRDARIPIQLPLFSHITSITAYFDRGSTAGSYGSLLVGTTSVITGLDSVTQYNTAAGTGYALASTGAIDITVSTVNALHVRIWMGGIINLADAEYRGCVVFYDVP